MPQTIYFPGIDEKNAFIATLISSSQWKRRPRKFFFKWKNNQKSHIDRSGELGRCFITLICFCLRNSTIILVEWEVMVKHESRNIHFLENFWKTFCGIPVCCYYLLFFQLDGFDQSRASKGNDMHYFFHCSLFFPPLFVWDHLQKAVLCFIDVLERQKTVW